MIYGRYKQLMEAPKHERGRVIETLGVEFNINPATWTRLKYVYEHYLLGDAYAKTLVEQLDSGAVTPAKADRQLKEAYDDDDLAAGVSSVKVADFLRELVRFDSYISVTGAALRRGRRVNRTGMTDEAVHDALALCAGISKKTADLADLLTRATFGGSTDHE